MHALRLILAGVFDRFPGLQIIIGQMGELIPFMLARIDEAIGGRTALDPAESPIELSVPEYFRRNLHITTSGLFTDPPLRCAIDTLGVDEILFAVDHPFSDGAKACRWIDPAPITDAERAKITHGNAERLLGLLVPAARARPPAPVKPAGAPFRASDVMACARVANPSGTKRIVHLNADV